MKDTIRRLLIVHAVVLVLAGVGALILWGSAGGLSAFVGACSFSVPVVLFSWRVLKASAGDQGQFWGRFMAAELLKWVTSAAFLGLAFLSGVFSPQPLLAGFLLSVLVQVFFPMFVRRGSES